MTAGRRASALDHQDESYFVSMTDLMVGMLFVFIIMLMAFALNYRQATGELKGARQARDAILITLQDILDRKGVRVEIDKDSGVLRLKADLLFEKARSSLTTEGQTMIDTVADALSVVVPCYAKAEIGFDAESCPNVLTGRLEAVFIEGHTDTDPFRGGPRDNWVLSAERAIQTFKTMTTQRPTLDRIRNDSGQYLLGVSGYEARRTISRKQDGLTEVEKAADRRIDIRFIMASPKPEEKAKPVEDTEKQMAR